MQQGMETMREALSRLEQAGYRDQFRAEDGSLIARDAERKYRPEELSVDEIVRFEGVSDPGEESAIFALHARADGVRGTYVVAYGPDIDMADVEMVRRLGRAESGSGPTNT